MNTASISFPLFGEGFVINPAACFSVFGFNIYFYGLLITAGYAAAAVYLIWRRDVVGLTKDNILDLVIMAVPCGLVGARIYYMIFNFDQYFGPGKWQNILAFREGGLAVYGGILASAVAFLVYSRVKKIPPGKLLDAAGFGLFIGQAVGRWGNFFNREAFGIETNVPWKMGLTFERNVYIASLDKTFVAGTPHYFHPAFLYESLWNAAGLVLMHVFSNKRKAKYPGQYFLFYVFWYGLGRALIEGFRIDSLYIPNTEVRVSQLLAVLSCAGAAVLLVLFRNRSAAPEGPDESAEIPDAEDEADAESAEIPDAEDEVDDESGGSPEAADEADDENPESSETDGGAGGDSSDNDDDSSDNGDKSSDNDDDSSDNGDKSSDNGGDSTDNDDDKQQDAPD